MLGNAVSSLHESIDTLEKYAFDLVNSTRFCSRNIEQNSQKQRMTAVKDPIDSISKYLEINFLKDSLLYMQYRIVKTSPKLGKLTQLT